MITPAFLTIILILAIGILIWDTIEVGRNDAANIVNAVFGSRIMNRRKAVLLAGVGVVAGATLSSGVMDTARKGIFDPTVFTLYQQVLVIYISVYIVDTILLYGYSAFGMPVSTTMTLVFELLGASFFLGLAELPQGTHAVQWDNANKVIAGIVWSIILSAIIGYVIMRISRGAIGRDSTDLRRLKMHGGWVGGGLLAALTYFMVVKGMKSIEIVSAFKKSLHSWHQIDIGLKEPLSLGEWYFVFAIWVVWALIITGILFAWKEKASRLLFPILTVVGMVAMAFAFGQNDLANCAAPGLAAFELHGAYQDGIPLNDAVQPPLGKWALFGCGILLVMGMSTKHAQRVTRAEVNTGSAGSVVRLWAPKWCIALATLLLKITHRPKKQPPLAPRMMTLEGKTVHYDPLRGAVIMSVAASVIATASALKLPVSTTYVAFAAVLATGTADRIFAAGDATLKMARFIWVVFSWFMAAAIASIMAGLVCVFIYYYEIPAVILCLAVNFGIRQIVKKRSDAQEDRIKAEAALRKKSGGDDDDHHDDDE